MPQLGVGVFVSALREALHAKEIDFAVHSYKDLPTAPADGLTLAAVPARDDPRDALVTARWLAAGRARPGPRIGTGAPRRVAQLHALGRGLVPMPVRGNVDTRLRKLADGDFDAFVLAAAGLRRLGRAAEITEILDPMLMLPAPAQGALAVECRSTDTSLVELLASLDDEHTRAAVTAERALLAALEAGCSAPVAALADVAEADDGGVEIYLRGAVFSLDGELAVRLSGTGTLTDATEVGRLLAAELLDVGCRLSTGSACMTRTRKTVGRISFVGAGPGDPGLLTRRAYDALIGADHIVYDRGVPDALLEWITAEVHGADARRAEVEPAEAAQFSPAEGVPGDVAKVLMSAARSGLRAVHLVAGDPFEHDAVVKEVQAVARTAVPFEVVPGVSGPAAVATYAGVALTGIRTTVDVDDVHSLDFEALAPAAQRGLALTVDAGDLAAVRDGLLSAGVDGTAPIAVTGDGTGNTQYTTNSTVDSFVAAALGFTGRVVLSLGEGLAQRDKLGWWENRPLYGWKVLVPRTKEQAGAMSERLRAYGAMPCEVPTIAVEPPRTPAQMERAIKGLVDGRYAWTIFTSVNAVRAVWEKFAEHGLDARHFGGVKIACIGEATADAVRAFGIQPELIPAGEQTGEGLLAEFSPHDEILDPVGRVLLPRADIATETLAAGLTDRGWEVDDVTAYRTVRAAPPPAEIRDSIKSGGFDAVLSRHPRRCETWSASPASRTPAQWSLSSDPRRPTRPWSSGCASTSNRPTPPCRTLWRRSPGMRSNCGRSSRRCRPSSVAARRSRARPHCGSVSGHRRASCPSVLSRRTPPAVAPHGRAAPARRRDPAVAVGARAADVCPRRADRASADQLAARRRSTHP